MTQIELIHRFWKINHTTPLGASSISLYLFLINKSFENRNKPLFISDSILAKELLITRQTIIVIRRKLCDYNLINCQIKIGKTTEYDLIIQEPEESEKLFIEKIDIEQNAKIPVEVEKIFETPTPTSLENIAKENGTKIRPSVFSKTAKATIKNESKLIIPTINEFLDYAKTLEIYTPQLDFSIKAKYDSWIENGWKNGYNKPIKNWQNSIKSTLPYLNSTSITNITSIPNIRRPKSTYNE